MTEASAFVFLKCFFPEDEEGLSKQHRELLAVNPRQKKPDELSFKTLKERYAPFLKPD